jgi:DNA-binding CsgD family transcriptional regulator
MGNVFSDFIDRIRGLDRPDALRSAMGRFAEGVGFESFMFLHSDDASGQNLLLSNYPDGWLEHYVASDYAHVDPVVARAIRSTSPFTWGHSEYLARLDGKQRQLFDEAGEFGVRQGICCTWRNGSGYVSGMSVATAKPEEEFRQLVNRHRVDIELACLYFCSHVENRVIGRGARIHADLLTVREKDCLTWTLQGWTLERMARAAGVLEPAIRECLHSATMKLKASQPTRAAARAVELGLICP